MLRKTYPMAITIICSLIITTHETNAGPCADAGYTIGQKCPIEVPMLTTCFDPDKGSNLCTMVECPTECLCLHGKNDCPKVECRPCPADALFWESVSGKNYEKRTSYIQNQLTCACTESPRYRCKAGYYSDGFTLAGNPPSCLQCPSYGKWLQSGDSFPGSSSISSCYVPTDADLSDTAGTYRYTQDCYYK